MSRRPARVTQADIARAIRAVEQTGANMVIEITADGVIRLVRPEASAGPREPNEWDIALGTSPYEERPVSTSGMIKSPSREAGA
jgi:hypothetical protein